MEERKMPEDCLFCKIIKGEIPADKVKETDRLIAIRDINPQAPTHILIIPHEHIEKVSDVKDWQAHLIGEMVTLAKEIAEDENISETGYRLVLNCGAEAGQAVFHIHLHLLGGRKMEWPPG